MALPPELNDRLTSIITSDSVVLFMKGHRGQPQCGFSAQITQVLDRVLADYTTFDVLSDMEVREGIKEFSDWPTIPQLYIGGEFQGGCDIVKEMYESGELHGALGLDRPTGETPAVTLTDAAATVFQGALQQQPGSEIHVAIDARFQHSFGVGPAEGDETRVPAGPIEVLMDLDTLARAEGLVIDAVDTPQGAALKVDNPNAPPAVQQLPVGELARMREAGAEFLLIDVRPEEERQRAAIEGATPLETIGDFEGVPRDRTIVLHCHHGSRSQAVAEELVGSGFQSVFNLAGGIDAWSVEVDSSVPRY
ncbi:MAG: Grx4 family monothiol glutaredoxin [Acidobacteriota bacterium]